MDEEEEEAPDPELEPSMGVKLFKRFDFDQTQRGITASHPPPTWSLRAVVRAGFAPSGWWHISFPVSLCPEAERTSPPAASFSLAVVEIPDNTQRHIFTNCCTSK